MESSRLETTSRILDVTKQTMNHFTLLATLFLLFVSSIYSLPVDPTDEVELVEPINTNSRDPELGGSGGFPVILIRTTGGNRNRFPFPISSFFNGGGFPFLSGGGFGEGEGEIEFDNEEEFPNIFREIFNHPRESETVDNEEEETPVCGFLCLLLKNFASFADKVQGEIDDIHKEIEDNKNEVEPNPVSSDGNSTYTEEVLSDGTIVKTNRTSFKSPDGLGFVFTQVTSFNSDKKSDDNENQDDVDEFDEEKPTDFEVPLLVVEESDDDNDEEVVVNNKGIDDGLVA